MSEVKVAMGTSKIRNFRDLDIWQMGKSITLEIYQMTSEYPDSENYGLVSQMRRASVSISSNIAEGFNRFHNSEYRQFLYIALGSCGELETQIEISHELGYISPSIRENIINKITHESRMIRNLIKKL